MFCRGFISGAFAPVGYGFGGGAIIMMIAFLVILTVTIYFLVKADGNRNAGHSASRTVPQAVEILNERLAKGEISEEEYQSRKNRMMQ